MANWRLHLGQGKVGGWGSVLVWVDGSAGCGVSCLGVSGGRGIVLAEGRGACRVGEVTGLDKAPVFELDWVGIILLADECGGGIRLAVACA